MIVSHTHALPTHDRVATLLRLGRDTLRALTRSTGFHSGSAPAPRRPSPRQFGASFRSAADEAPVVKAQDGEGGGLRQRRGARFPSHSRFSARNKPPHPGENTVLPAEAHTRTPANPISRNLTPTSPARAVCKEGVMIAVMNVPKMDERTLELLDVKKNKGLSCLCEFGKHSTFYPVVT